MSALVGATVATPRIPRSRSRASTSPLRVCGGRSTCVVSPETTIFEPLPIRVRNIFICETVVFWASSRMMNESLSVRPRMYANGMTSIRSSSV